VAAAPSSSDPDISSWDAQLATSMRLTPIALRARNVRYEPQGRSAYE